MKVRTVFFALVIVFLALSACSRAKEPSGSSEDLAPDFSLQAIDGETIVLSDILKEKIVVLDFWASWCTYCVRAMPRMEEFYAQNKDKVTVIGINVGESESNVRKFAQRIGISYPIALDFDSNVARAYKVRGIPTIVAVDKNGTILYYGHSIEEMVAKIEF